jgi:hypothetical protein
MDGGSSRNVAFLPSNEYWKDLDLNLERVDKDRLYLQF